MRFARHIAYSLIFLLLAASCATERSLAKRFVTDETSVNILILPPTGLIKSYYPINPDSLPQGTDQYNLEDGQFLHLVEDSLIIRYFIETLSQELEEFDVRVFLNDEIDSFFKLDTNAFIFSIAQIQLMEYPDEKIDYTMIDTTVYEADMEIATLVFNTWFEYTELNHPERPMEVLFSMQHRSDYIDGRFRKNWLTGEVTYEFRPYRLTIDDVYDLTWVAGRQNAQYIFDFLLNQYVSDNISKNIDRLEYFQYDRERHVIRRAYNEKFYRYPPEEDTNNQAP